MKNITTALLSGAFILITTFGTAQKVELKNADDSLSYAIGISLAKSFVKQNLDLDVDLLAQGIKDRLADSNEWSAEDAELYLGEEMAVRAEELQMQMKKENEDWLIKNAKEKGVKSTPSGLQYKVIQEGTGASPDKNDKVTVNYRGTLIDGTEFDSSYKRNKPMTFDISRVIKGWTEGLLMMKEGGKWMFYIPEFLGYGGRPGPGGSIPAFSTLIFEVELLEVKPVD